MLIAIILLVPAQLPLIHSQPSPAASKSNTLNDGIVFVKTWSSSAPYVGKAVVTDSHGNIYVVGSGWPGLILLNYDSTGHLLWDRQWSGGVEMIAGME